LGIVGAIPANHHQLVVKQSIAYNKVSNSRRHTRTWPILYTLRNDDFTVTPLIKVDKEDL